MTRAEIYRKAAKSVEDFRETYSCIAVCHAEDTYRVTPAERAYSLRFSEVKGRYLTVSQAIMGGGREWRILALCFAAAMAETGDL